MTATVKSYYGNEEVTLSVNEYVNNQNLAIQMWCDEGPYATLTVNLDKKCRSHCAYVDVNNCPWAEDFIKEYSLGKPTGAVRTSGWCTYPEYEFDLEQIKKYK